MTGRRLLVVDDEDNLRSMLGAALRHHGYQVATATDGPEALAALANEPPHLVVLDVMMPGMDGFEVCRRMRAANDQTPVLFLTARDDTEDKVRGLRLGGDDYLEKPFSLDELTARIDAILRRTDAHASGAVLELDDLRVDDDAHLVVKAGVHIHLSPTEHKLLRYLLMNQGRVVSKTQILDGVWGYEFDGDGGVVETYVGYLRRKLDTSEPKLIHTIRGAGYTMRVQP
ncbi:MAG: response regulator transcription factor [Actinomycetota bacterium]